MNELDALALNFLLGDRSVFADDAELNGFVRRLSDLRRAQVTAMAGPGQARALHPRSGKEPR